MPSKKIPFAHAFQRPKTICNQPGSRISKVYELCYSDTGEKILVHTRDEDLYAKRQESLEGTKISSILRRYALGDYSAIEKKHGFFGDATMLPRDLLEAQQMIDRVKSDFMSLPVETREKFGHNVFTYVSEMSSGVGLSKLSPEIRKVEVSQAVAIDNGGVGSES